ncbi:MAG: hypothetical protein J7K57_09460 [Palaeococcus sp.]|uniref:hypothetical protein n=1 Tax=Palaeococcus sp. (in: euryarchaeotes) TaxID=2820298 RepID=UPI0025D5645E|nr:hypothetical protein [Palaeococcus sp. (in: euryarchaeotes)]MCD6560070.1 hypothetical protein [Palaeococcus sp. (in: euryarchaeotes)]
MRKAQISLDLLFAIFLILLTLVNLTYLATSETAHSEMFSTISEVKTFSISLRDHITKVYAVGEGFKKKEVFPFNLESGESIRIHLNSSSNSIIINATIDGKSYTITQRSDVPLKDSNVTLTNSKREFWISTEISGGMLYVKVEP